jgi:geranylgeranylglycerol-phosphate geranylgeranyltransferase
MQARIYTFVAETRPLNCLMAAFATLMGVLVSKVAFVAESVGVAVLAFIVVLLVAAGGNVINDYFDFAIDRVNRPDRAVPSGKITRQAALLYALALSVLGVATSLFINAACFALAALNAILLVLYSWKLKRSALVGNLLVGYLTGSVFLFGGAAVSAIFLPGVLFVSAMLAITSREIVKDVEDLAGDRTGGATTFPIRYGVKASLVVATLFMLAAVVISPLPFIIGALGSAYLGIVVIADVTLLCGSALSWSTPSKASGLIKYAMLVVLLAYLVGII